MGRTLDEIAIFIPDLIANFYDEDWWNDKLGEECYIVERRMAPTKCSDYWDPKEHLKNFCNANIIEHAFAKAYGLYFGNLFYDWLDGYSQPKADLYRKSDGCKVEVKKFKNEERFMRWIDGATGTYDQGYDCDVYLVYVIGSRKSYVVNPKNKQEYHLAKHQIEVKLL